MKHVRKAAVAGMFYPDHESDLSEMVDKFISDASAEDIVPKAVIAPHAGFVYSGSIAGTAYAYLQNGASQYRRVVLLGPSHRVPLAGVAVPSARFFETPLGRVPIDTSAIDQIISLPFVQIHDSAHAQEHSLEVQLPFLQRILSDFILVPLVVGHVTADNIAEVLGLLANDDDTVIVVSSDLSHYLQYEEARRLDSHTSCLIEDLDFEQISPEQACGAYPVKGLLCFAKKSGWQGKTAHTANSGDTAGSRDAVVGYGSYIFFERPVS